MTIEQNKDELKCERCGKRSFPIDEFIVQDVFEDGMECYMLCRPCVMLVQLAILRTIQEVQK